MNWETILFISGITYLLTTHKISYPFREWVAGNMFYEKEIYTIRTRLFLVWKLLSDLLECPFCFSFWVALIYFRSFELGIVTGIITYALCRE